MSGQSPNIPAADVADESSFAHWQNLHFPSRPVSFTFEVNKPRLRAKN
jgi:hypothetical protein